MCCRRKNRTCRSFTGVSIAEKVEVLLRAMVPAAAVDHVFVCGPVAMSEDIEKTCVDMGIPAERVHVERFVSEFGGKPRPKVQVAPEAPPKAVASLIVDGKRKDVPIAEGEVVLDAALRAGMDLPYAARAACARHAAPRLSKAK
jgi:ring-1,2-phenylacetyl-CoA epoxidase subunit PaaE